MGILLGTLFVYIHKIVLFCSSNKMSLTQFSAISTKLKLEMDFAIDLCQCIISANFEVKFLLIKTQCSK